MFDKKWSVCMVVKLLSSYIQCLNWFYACFDLYCVSIYLNYCSLYNIGWLTKSDHFVWLWNVNNLVFISLLDSLHVLIRFLFLFYLIIVAHMKLVVWQEVIILYGCETIIILNTVHWLILYYFKSGYSFSLF